MTCLKYRVAANSAKLCRQKKTTAGEWPSLGGAWFSPASPNRGVPGLCRPVQVLVILLARLGEVITREELRDRLWDRDAFHEQLIFDGYQIPAPPKGDDY